VTYRPCDRVYIRLGLTDDSNGLPPDQGGGQHGTLVEKALTQPNCWRILLDSGTVVACTDSWFEPETEETKAKLLPMDMVRLREKLNMTRASTNAGANIPVYINDGKKVREICDVACGEDPDGNQIVVLTGIKVLCKANETSQMVSV